jgi:hypothetical protein
VKSVVLIIPADLQADANMLAAVLGYDQAPGNTYSVRLSANGNEPISHYGCHTWAHPPFVQMISAARDHGVLPDLPWHPLTADRVLAVCNALIVSARDDMSGHFSAATADAGLQIVRVIQTPQ